MIINHNIKRYVVLVCNSGKLPVTTCVYAYDMALALYSTYLGADRDAFVFIYQDFENVI